MSSPAKRGYSFEKRKGKELGKRQVASGSKWFAKSDIRTEKFLLDCKYCNSPFFTLQFEWIADNDFYAMQYGKIPVIYLGFRNGSEFAIMEQSHLDYTSENLNITELKRRGKHSLRLSELKLRQGTKEGNCLNFSIEDTFYVVLSKKQFLKIKDKYEESFDDYSETEQG